MIQWIPYLLSNNRQFLCGNFSFFVILDSFAMKKSIKANSISAFQLTSTKCTYYVWKLFLWRCYRSFSAFCSQTPYTFLFYRAVFRLIITGMQLNHCMAFQIMITSIVINVTISSIMIGFKNSYFLLIHLPSCYQTVQYANHINSCSLNQQISPFCNFSFSFIPWLFFFSRKL